MYVQIIVNFHPFLPITSETSIPSSLSLCWCVQDGKISPPFEYLLNYGQEKEKEKRRKNLALRLSPVVVLIIIRGTGFVIILYVYHRPFLCPYQSWREGCPITNVAERDLVSALPSSFFLRGKEGGGRHVSYYSGGGGESWNLGSSLSALLLPT